MAWVGLAPGRGSGPPTAVGSQAAASPIGSSGSSVGQWGSDKTLRCVRTVPTPRAIPVQSWSPEGPNHPGFCWRTDRGGRGGGFSQPCLGQFLSCNLPTGAEAGPRFPEPLPLHPHCAHPTEAQSSSAPRRPPLSPQTALCTTGFVDGDRALVSSQDTCWQGQVSSDACSGDFRVLQSRAPGHRSTGLLGLPGWPGSHPGCRSRAASAGKCGLEARPAGPGPREEDPREKPRSEGQEPHGPGSSGPSVAAWDGDVPGNSDLSM